MGQALPQLPQFAESVNVDVQTSPHTRIPKPQDMATHDPPTHISLLVQAIPHPPQLAESLFVFTHEPLQLVVPKPQVAWQVPNEQTWVDVQAVAQLPQCIGSLNVSTQLPLQLI